MPVSASRRASSGPSSSVLDELEQRGLVAQVSSRQLRRHLEQQPRSLYLGVDPSARSLHVGNLLALVGLLHFQLRGHRAIALIGGATGSVGDPSGRSSERKALSEEELNKNIDALSKQVRQLCERGVPFAARKAGLLSPSSQGGPASNIDFVNNRDWIGKMSLIDFLGGPGKRARVSTMLSRDSVKNRLNSESGISFTEFSYQLLQAYDFYHLHKYSSCTLQIGGSDQWGNIQSGIEMIRREGLSQEQLVKETADTVASKGKEPAFGLTLPLLTTSSGEKFGKSAGNAVWLDPEMTSPFEFYQFFLRTNDEDVERYLRIFSFAPLADIETTIKHHRFSPESRIAQKKLAKEVTELVHGEAGLNKALAATEISFGRAKISDYSAEEILGAFPSTLITQMSRKEALYSNIASLIVRSGVIGSKTQAKQIMQNGGVFVNDRKVVDTQEAISASDYVSDRVLVLRAGKTTVRVVEIVTDVDGVAQDLSKA